MISIIELITSIKNPAHLKIEVPYRVFLFHLLIVIAKKFQRNNFTREQNLRLLIFSIDEDKRICFSNRTNNQIKEPRFRMSDYMSVAHVSGGRLHDRSAPGFKAPMENSQQTDHLLRLRDVIEKTSLSRSTIYRWVDSGRFPQPFRVGGLSIRWKSSSIDLWIGALNRG